MHDNHRIANIRCISLDSMKISFFQKPRERNTQLRNKSNNGKENLVARSGYSPGRRASYSSYYFNSFWKTAKTTRGHYNNIIIFYYIVSTI